MPLILPGNVASALGGAYEVANSCRFNDGDTATLEKALGTPSSQTIFTWSCWFKRGVLTGDQSLFSCGSSGDTERFDFRLNSGGEFYFNIDLASNYRIQTTHLYRDCSAWYNFVLAYDTTQATDTNRVKLWVNGKQLTGSSITVTNYPPEDYVITAMASGQNVSIGKRQYGSALNLDGYLAEVCYCDGQTYTASDFGEFDEDSPTIWKPKDVSGLTFGNNGFYLDFEDSSNLGNDANGGTDLTEANLAAADQATDTPTNNFATLNHLYKSNNSLNFSEGNCEVQGVSGNGGRFTGGTFAPASGKWWCEIKVTVSGSYPIMGVIDSSSSIRENVAYFVNADSGTNQSGFAIFSNADVYHNNDNTFDTWQSYATNDIIGMGINMDAATPTITFQKNGGSEETFTTEVPNSGHYIFPAIGNYMQAAIAYCNFGGCPSYTISSAVADENGYGSFEYAPKSGYLAMCSKNIGENS